MIGELKLPFHQKTMDDPFELRRTNYGRDMASSARPFNTDNSSIPPITDTEEPAMKPRKLTRKDRSGSTKRKHLVASADTRSQYEEPLE